MAPVLHIVRHAQGYHSVAKDGHLIRDPALTPRGEDECRRLRENFGPHDQVDLLLASPMRRAIQTALIAFSPYLERGLRVVAVPDAQEGTSELSDTGSDAGWLQIWFDDKVDLQYVKPDWYLKEGENSTEVAAIFERAKRLRRWIRDRPEKQVVLVTHGRFAHYLTGHVNARGEQTSTWWVDGEFRSYRFAADEPHDENAMLLETDESKERRKEKDA